MMTSVFIGPQELDTLHERWVPHSRFDAVLQTLFGVQVHPSMSWPCGVW